MISLRVSRVARLNERFCVWGRFGTRGQMKNSIVQGKFLAAGQRFGLLLFGEEAMTETPDQDGVQIILRACMWESALGEIEPQ